MDNALDGSMWSKVMGEMSDCDELPSTSGETSVLASAAAAAAATASALTDTPSLPMEVEFKPTLTSTPMSPEATGGKRGMSRLQRLKALNLRLDGFSSEQFKLAKNGNFRTCVANGACDDVKRKLSPLFQDDQDSAVFADDEKSEGSLDIEWEKEKNTEECSANDQCWKKTKESDCEKENACGASEAGNVI